ncbi:hypothetical protein DFH11DRAFT_1637248 [Phellopilus nigrolimitatus]|nr:hypothetical protein DFH11DRAFT_1637248 [Phellopilus nigrolimitatus]
MDDAVTSSLGTRLRARGRMSYPSHSGRMPFDMNPTPGPVRTTKFGMPEKDDFQDFPDVAFLDDVFVAPSPVDLQAKVKELQVALIDQARKYDALEGENRKLKKELGHMKSKYQIIGKMYASAKSAMKQNEGSSHGTSLGNVMICDADDERELPSAAASYTQASVLTSASSLSSASSSSNFRTPSTTPGMPVREIDEDYDEGYDSAALRLAAINDHIIMTSGMNDFDMEIERVAEQLHKRFNLNDNKNDVPARNDVSQAPAFPSLDMPSMPKFFF